MGVIQRTVIIDLAGIAGLRIRALLYALVIFGPQFLRMFRQTALLFSMLVHTFISPAFAHVQTNPPAIGARSPSTTACRELSFSGRINGDEEYARELGDKLWFRFAPTKGKWGWIVSVGPADNANGRFGDWHDYAWPVSH